MPFDEGDGPDDLFSRLRSHEAREIIEARRKFQWRFTTLSNDFRDLLRLERLPVTPSRDVDQQLQNQGYVFEVERRLHHYLAGLYTLAEVHHTLQSGIGQGFRDQLSDIEDRFRSEESSRALFGLRHYVQHENVLPLQPHNSSIEGESRIVILLDDLHRHDDRRNNFQAHYGHIDEPYLRPLELVEESWPHVEEFFADTMEVVAEQAEPEIEDYQQLLDYVEGLNEEIHQQLLSDEDELPEDFSFFDSGDD